MSFASAIAGLLGRSGAKAPDPKSSDPKPPGSATDKGAIATPDDPAHVKDSMAELRKLLQRTATAIGVVATAVIGGLVYLKEIFPIPQTVPFQDWVWILLVAALVAAAIGGAAWVMARFFLAQRQILVTTVPDGVEGLSDEDKLIAWSVFNEHAAEENADSLFDLDRRRLRLERIGTSSGPTSVAAKEASRLGEAVTIALALASASILEDRTRGAFQSRHTLIPFVLAVVGIVGLFAIADYHEGERSLSDLRTKCAKAEAADVPDACAPFESAAQRRDRSVAAAAAKAAATNEKAQATTNPTAAQKALLARIALCTRQIAGAETLRSLDGVAKAQAIALCAAA
jgi:hypothetical protein